MNKYVFIDGHKRSQLIKVSVKYLIFIKVLELYLIVFQANSTIKAKVYPMNYQVGGKKLQVSHHYNSSQGYSFRQWRQEIYISND